MGTRNRLRTLRSAWVGLALVLTACGEENRSPLTIPIAVRGRILRVEVAADPESRALGLMFRRELAADGGMLFVFPDDATRTFWMRNTYLPLSIAFLDAGRRILNLLDMTPLDESLRYRSEGPARYALEVSQGWFQANGVVPGDECVFELPAGLVAR